MEVSDFKTMDTQAKAEYVHKAKNDIIGSFKQKYKYWEQGLIETLLSDFEELEVSPELQLGVYSIFVCYTNNFDEAYDAFKYQENFSDKIVDTLKKAIEQNLDTRIIDLSMQILRNLFVNDIIPPEKATSMDVIPILDKLVYNNKRINLVAQIISKLAKESNDIKNTIIDQKTILDSIIACIEENGSDNLRISLLDWLVSLSTNHDKVTSYVRDNINIQQLISLIKYQNNEINAKVAYLATIMNNDKNTSRDFENLVKQIIFQITRMLQSSEVDEIEEATLMLYNLVKSNNDETSAGKKSLSIHTCEIGWVEILTKILGKYVDDYLEFMRNVPTVKEEVKEQVIADKESLVEDVTGNFSKCRSIIMNILKITQSLMNAHSSCLKKIVGVNIPHHCFKLLDKIVGDEIKITTCECLRILARAKKPMKIQIIEEDHDLEKLFKGLINDSNMTIKKLGMAIIWNFSIDFPGMILTFKDFFPLVSEFLVQDKNIELKLFSIKTLKNLLYANHPIEVCRNAEKIIFDWISIKEICKWLDDSDDKIREQAEIIFKNLKIVEKIQQNEDKKPKSVLELIDDEVMKSRINKIWEKV